MITIVLIIHFHTKRVYKIFWDVNNKSYKLSYPWLRSCVRVREKGERPPRREQGIQNTGVASCSQRTSKTDFSSHPTRSPSSISSLWPRPHRTRGDKRPCRLSSSLPPLSFGSVTALPRLPAAQSSNATAAKDAWRNRTSLQTLEERVFFRPEQD